MVNVVVKKWYRNKLFYLLAVVVVLSGAIPLFVELLQKALLRLIVLLYFLVLYIVPV